MNRKRRHPQGTGDKPPSGSIHVATPADGPTRRSLLFIENQEHQWLGLCTPAKDAGWHVTVQGDPDKAFRLLEELIEHNNPPDVVSIDLGLLDKPNRPDYGLACLSRISKRWGRTLNVIVHSGIPLEETVMRRVLAAGASYFHLNEGSSESYVKLLEHVARGYAVYSPGPAALLPSMVALKPDPWAANPEFWRMAPLLHEGLTYKKIASHEQMKSEAGVMDRVKRMAQALADGAHVPPLHQDGIGEPRISREPYREVVVEWYRQNRSYYGY